MSALTDVRIGLRLLWKDKAFTLTAVLTLALCIGANTALFSVVRGVLLKPLAIPEPDRVVNAGNTYPGAGVHRPIGASVPDYFDRLREVTAFEEQALLKTQSYSVVQSGVPARVEAMSVTPSFFRLAGVKPQLGRTFSEQEGEVGNTQVVVLSDGFWRSQLGGDPGIVGRDLRLDGVSHTVIGVMPARFRFPSDDTALWTPMSFTPEARADDERHSNNALYIARLKPGATVEQAQSQIDALNTANLDRFPALKEIIVNTRFRTVVQPIMDLVVEDVRPVLYLLWAGALFVLLIGCVNVANLVLVRSRVRLKELATRLALGAGTWRLAQQLVIENLILTFVSAAVGLAVGAAALQAMGAINLEDLPRAAEVALDGSVALYTVGVAAAIGLVLGTIPLLAAMPSNLIGVLRVEGRTGTSAAGARTLRRGLVIAQVACAFVLLIGAGLLFASFRQVLKVDAGFGSEGVLTGAVSLPDSRYKDDDALRRFTIETLRRLREQPGVLQAGATDSIPFGSNQSASAILAEGYQAKPGESIVAPNEVRVSDGYFEVMGARLVGGRFFTERDGPDAPRVAVIDERLARRFWPNQDAVGRRLYRPNDDGADLTAITAKTEFITVVGVIREMKLRRLTDGDQLVGAYYLPLAQEPQDDVTFALKASADPATLAGTLRGTVTALDSQLPVFEMQPMTYWVDKSVATHRSPALLSVGFGVVALLLSAIGIYGVLAYLVAQRTKEIGIRIALGSSAPLVFWLVLREGVLLVGAGLVIGGAGTMLLGRALESLLFGVRTSDPLVLLTVSLLLAAVAFTACAVPARRATAIDPLTALADS
jgi:predicted permease